MQLLAFIQFEPSHSSLLMQLLICISTALLTADTGLGKIKETLQLANTSCTQDLPHVLGTREQDRPPEHSGHWWEERAGRLGQTKPGDVSTENAALSLQRPPWSFRVDH